MKVKGWYLVFLSIFFCSIAHGQFEPLRREILATDSFNRAYPREKIFLHLDRPYYNLKDTIWIKGYILSAMDLAAMDSSQLVYIDMLDNSGQVIKRSSTYSSAGIFFANLRLPETDFRQGVYWLRTHTQFMRNYGDSTFPLTRFAIIGSGNPDWEISLSRAGVAEGKFFLQANLLPATGQTFNREEVSLVLKAKNKTLLRQKVTTGVDGLLIVQEPVSEIGNTQELQLQLSVGRDFSMQVPVYVQEKMQLDLQFLPEGGNLLAGQRQRLGFKALNSTGRGVDVKGHIENAQGSIITQFASVHKGMGLVWLRPEAGERYTAVLDDGQRFVLPQVQQSGTRLQVDNDPASDSVVVWVDASADMQNKSFFFRASSHGISCAMGVVRIRSQPYRVAIAKKAFPSGISRFTLFDEKGLPVNERTALIWHKDTLQIELTTDKPAYGNRDSVSVTVQVRDAEGQPVVGSFSLAVIDTGRVSPALHADNIISYLLLSSDLKGAIEDPAYYFDDPLPEAVDALMLTQGWVQYNRAFAKPTYAYEKQFMVTGRVTNLLNKPVKGSELTLLGKDGRFGSFISQGRTDEKGRFTFNDFPLFVTDTVGMLIKASNKKGKQFGIGIELDMPRQPGAPASPMPAFARQDIAYDTAVALQLQQKTNLYRGLRRERGYLPEVIVKSRLRIKGSKNLNEDREADQTITEAMLEKDAKEELLYILNRDVKGFNRSTFPKSNIQTYKVNGDFAVFVIDGFNINRNYEPTSPSPTAFVDYLNDYLKYIRVEEVVGIEVLTSPGNTFAYENEFNLRPEGGYRYAFIEITTRSGNGAFYKSLPGTYLYKPTAPSVGKMFYSPRYTSNEMDPTILDYRSTLFWKPDIITNEQGRAQLSFYTSDSKTGYLMIIQGTDMSGGVGVKRQVLRK
ncbi:MAG: hypothetical protein QM781_16750 [Chitinophagaceae bacterium]